ncbi:hypothetical protein ABVK25_010157 [Lepraria finkii]|uniref:Uncharacterized protein n=1 Tax=Lepraria finkii TaxID=1340010 RepID=A0ABR4AWR5_9LECA
MQSLYQQFTESQHYTCEGEPNAPPAYEPRELALPVLNRQSPWWEREVRRFLCSGQIELIPRLLQFHFFGHKNSLYDALPDCETSRLNEILAWLTVEGTNPEGQRIEIIEKIVKRVERTCSSLHLFKLVWTWRPCQTDLDVEKIADVINQGSMSLLADTWFEECWRHALGYTEPSVENLVSQHRCIAWRIRSYLDENPIMRGTYHQVEQKLRNRNPLAHQAVMYSLLPETPANICLDLICEPLRYFVENPTLSLSAILLRLPILAERFDYIYRGAFFHLWPPRFTIEMDTFDALIADSPPLEYAKEMPLSDRLKFDSLSLQTLRARGPQFQQIFQRGCSFSIEVAACGKAHPRLNYRLNEIAQGLYDCCNWYRLGDLVCGQQRAGLNSVYSDLFDPTDNFAVYRAEMEERPGLPFLAPYLREDYPTGDADIFKTSTSRMEEPVLSRPTTLSRFLGFVTLKRSSK